MKKFLSFLLVWCLLSVFPVTAETAVTVSSEYKITAEDEAPLDTAATNAAIGQTLDIKAKSAVLMEPVTGKVLYEANADQPLPPASITKVMSLLLIMEAIDRGDIDLETVVTASEHACSMGGSQIWLEPGETMTVDELLKATVIASANDACVALGELIAGSEEGFVAQMNARAQELGMTNTHFENCTGLDADGHVTTAYDVAVMSSALIQHDLIKNYSTVWMDTLRDGKSELVNTNKLVRFYEGATGLKTGTTSVAKYCLSATAERNGLQLVAVILAGDTSNDRFNGAKKLLDYGFANYSFSAIEAELPEDLTVMVEKGVNKNISVQAEGTLEVLLPKSDANNIVRTVKMDETVAAPVSRGDRVGEVALYNGDELLGVIPIVSAEDSERLSLGYTICRILKGFLQL